MRKASMVLGIVGGALSLVMALLSIVAGILFMTSNSYFLSDLINSMHVSMGIASSLIMELTTNILGVVLIIYGVIKAICGALGLFGGLMVNKKNVTAGVMMIVAASISLILGGWLTMIVFTLGSIFALVKQKPTAAPVQPPEQ